MQKININGTEIHIEDGVELAIEDGGRRIVVKAKGVTVHEHHHHPSIAINPTPMLPTYLSPIWQIPLTNSSFGTPIVTCGQFVQSSDCLARFDRFRRLNLSAELTT
jgi:hypothetical protein